MLQIGLESGSQKVLDAFGKGVELSLAEKVLAAMKEAGIASYTYLLFGTPWEREEDARLTLDFTAAHADEISCLNLAVFNLQPVPTNRKPWKQVPSTAGTCPCIGISSTPTVGTAAMSAGFWTRSSPAILPSPRFSAMTRRSSPPATPPFSPWPLLSLS